ncbi:hypothetical protein V7128_17865 [Neobacillus vireti]
MAKDRMSEENNGPAKGQNRKTLDDIKKKNPLNWGVIDMAESVHHPQSRD